MIKKIVLLLSFCFLINPCFAVGQDKYAFVSAVEQKLFGSQFKSEDINKRLNRIEINVFGIKSGGTPLNRINKLKTVFGQEEKKIEPVQKTQPQNKPVQKPPSHKKVQEENLTVRYAVVDDIEKKVLNHTYTQDDIYRRLGRLETVVFSNTINAPLNKRVENLKNAVYGKDKSGNTQIAQKDPTTLNDESISLLLGKMETDTFNRTYPNEPVDTRLSRLEMQLFNSASPEDPVNDRIERLSAVISARPTNELYKDMSAIRQYQDMTTKISAAAILLLLIKGLLF